MTPTEEQTQGLGRHLRCAKRFSEATHTIYIRPVQKKKYMYISSAVHKRYDIKFLSTVGFDLMKPPAF
jgi:hypothetical protein